MSLISQIQTLQLQARRTASPDAALLTTLLSEAAMVGKNAQRETTDAEVVDTVKKFVKNIDQTLTFLQAAGNSATDAAELARRERQVLEQFLPHQLSDYELTAIAVGRSSMPDFMKYLKENYAGQYDGRAASAVAKQVYNK
jgi:uncharacterized protein YqeY